MISVRVNTESLRATLNAKADAVTKAGVRSINEAMTTMKKEARQALSSELGLPAKAFKPRARVTEKATRTRFASILSLRPYSMPLKLFGATKVKVRTPKAKRGANWRWGVKLTKGVLKGTMKDPAFLTTVGKGKHEGVFIRKGVKRLPIAELFVKKEIVKVMQEHSRTFSTRAMARFNEVFPRNLKFFLEKSKG